MSRGILIGDKHTYDDWGLILTKVDIGYPAPKTNYIDIPHGNGSLDLTETMGGVKYSDRTGTFEFDLIAPPSERQSLLTTITNYVHGKKHTIVLPDDPNFVYHSRLAINNVQTSYMLNKLVINVVSDPYRVKPTATVKELYLVENLIPENARQFESPPWVKYQGAEVDVTPAPMAVFNEGYSRNLVKNSEIRIKEPQTSGLARVDLMTASEGLDVGTYTISFDYEMTTEGVPTYFLLRSIALGSVRLIPTNEQGEVGRCVFTFPIQENVANDGITLYGGEDNLDSQPRGVIFTNIKIEKGNNPNPIWTPAWEDLPIEDKPVSFIEISGGTSRSKYFTSFGMSIEGVKYQFGGKFKNIGDSNLVISSNVNYLREVDVYETIELNDIVIGNGISHLQYKFRTQNISDNLAFYAYQPAVYEIHGDTDVYMFDGEVEVNILNEGDNVVHKITTDADITIKFKDHTFTVNAGTHILPGLVLEYGDNIVIISGEDGTSVKFEYTERVI